MHHSLFMCITNTLAGPNAYFQEHPNHSGIPVLSTLQMCTTACRQLAYGSTSNQCDEYLHVTYTTEREYVNKVCHGFVEVFNINICEGPPLRHHQCPIHDEFARENSRISWYVGKHSLYTLDSEILLERVERCIHERLQGNTFDFDPRSSY